MMRSFAIAVIVTGAFECSGVSFSVERVQQRYPWNGLVDIDYAVTYDADEKYGDCAKLSSGDRLEFALTDRTNGKVYYPKTFTGPAIMEDGTHRVTWDSVADGFATISKDAKFDATLVRLAAEYMVIDVSDGASAEMYPVVITSEVPSGGFNQEMYKGDKIVLLKIPAGSFWAGSPPDEWKHSTIAEPLRLVTISKPFYLGIFEITQKQYANVMGADVEPCANPGDYYPRDKVSIGDIRDGWSEFTPFRPDSTRKTTFMSKLCEKCRLKYAEGVLPEQIEGSFDLPTEWQWEYACRAGTTTPYNNGVMPSSSDEYASEMAKVGRFSGNVNDGNGGSSKMATTVGTYAPNAWGLYDMHGNVWEWCRDYNSQASYTIGAPPEETTDPILPKDNGYSIHRGGCSVETADCCRSAYRGTDKSSYRSNYGGFRLCCTVSR